MTRSQAKPRPGADVAGLEFGELGYARNALESFAIFARLQEEGVIPVGTRFQVRLPTPLAPIGMFITEEAQAQLEPLYEARMMNDLDRILDGIPHDRLSIQWDVCIEVWMWERWLPAPFADLEAGIVERVARLSDAVTPVANKNRQNVRSTPTVWRTAPIRSRPA